MPAHVGRIQLIDIGANLLSEQFRGEYYGRRAHDADVAAVIRRAHAHSVVRILLTASELADTSASIELCRQYADIMPMFTTVGIHPCTTKAFAAMSPDEREAHVNSMRALLNDPQSRRHIVAIGECGLDYDRLEYASKEEQATFLPYAFTLAAESRLPMFLHDRNTNGLMLQTLKQHRNSISGAVVHSFTGSLEDMRAIVELQCYVGINGCSLKTAENCAVAAAVPNEWLLIETDAPWCDIKPTHHSYQYVQTHFPTVKHDKYQSNVIQTNTQTDNNVNGGFVLVKGRNEPSALVSVIEVLAAIKGINIEELSQIVYNNTMKLFFSEQSDTK